MFYGLATNKVRVPGLKFTHTLSDIEALNRKAKDAFYDLTAVSFHAYPYLQDQYALLSSGGSVGEGYGPMIVANREYSIEQIKTKKIAVPGMLTTAYLVLKLFAPDVQTEVVPFDQIIPQVLQGRHEAGLIIQTNTSEGIAEAVRALYGSTLKRAAVRAYAERFSWSEVVDGLITFLQRNKLPIGRDVNSKA